MHTTTPPTIYHPPKHNFHHNETQITNYCYLNNINIKDKNNNIKDTTINNSNNNQIKQPQNNWVVTSS